MKQVKTYALSVLCLAALSACSSQRSLNWPSPNPFTQTQAPKGQSIKIIFTSNILGESEPCGCAVGPKGGLDRRWNFLKKEKVDGQTLILDAGNSLFSSNPIDPARETAYRQAAEGLLEAHAKMGVAVQNVGHLDLALGDHFLRLRSAKAGLKLVSSNWVDSSTLEPVFPQSFQTQLNGVNIHVFGLSAGYPAAETQWKLKTLDPQKTLKTLLSKVPQGDMVVVLSDLGNEADEALARALKRPMIFVGARDLSSLSLPLHVDSSILVQSQFKGQQWGVLDISWHSEINHWYNLSERQRFSALWEEALLRQQSLEALPASKDKNLELAKVQKSASELLKYAPGAEAGRGVYQHRLVDLGDAYRGKNEFSQIMQKIKSAE